MLVDILYVSVTPIAQAKDSGDRRRDNDLVIGPRLNARNMNRQITENQIATKSLNRMTRLGRAVFKRSA
jgi:hypothetical protein